MVLLITSLRIAVRALGRNKLRTLLTMLGMIIGVGAVVTMVALGNGAQQTVEQDVRSAGTNLIDVNAGNYTRGGETSNIATGLGAATTLTPDDAAAIARIAGVKAAAPGVKLRGWLAAGQTKFYTQILGTAATLRRHVRLALRGRPVLQRRGRQQPRARRRPRPHGRRSAVSRRLGRGRPRHHHPRPDLPRRRRDQHGGREPDRDGVRAVHGAPGRAADRLPAHDHGRSRAGRRVDADRRRRHDAAAAAAQAAHRRGGRQDARRRRDAATRCRDPRRRRSARPTTSP